MCVCMRWYWRRGHEVLCVMQVLGLKEGDGENQFQVLELSSGPVRLIGTERPIDQTINDITWTYFMSDRSNVDVRLIGQGTNWELIYVRSIRGLGLSSVGFFVLFESQLLLMSINTLKISFKTNYSVIRDY